jgi:hypothetical protein
MRIIVKPYKGLLDVILLDNSFDVIFHNRFVSLTFIFSTLHEMFVNRLHSFWCVVGGIKWYHWQ